MRPSSRCIGLERQAERNSAAKGMSDDGEIAKVLVLDKLGDQLGLIEHRIALVERLVGLAEALEVDGDDPVSPRKLRGDVAPRVSACAKPVKEEDRRSLALILVVEVDRGLGRTEPGERTARAVARAEPARAEHHGDGGKTQRRLQLTLGHTSLRPNIGPAMRRASFGFARPPNQRDPTRANRFFALLPRFAAGSGNRQRLTKKQDRYGCFAPFSRGNVILSRLCSIDAHNIP